MDRRELYSQPIGLADERLQYSYCSEHCFACNNDLSNVREAVVTSLSTVEEDIILKKILSCREVVSDLELFLKEYLDQPTQMTEDQVSNIILGMMHIYKMRFDYLLREYHEGTKSDPPF